jgi:adenylylsulfate kinase
MRSSRARAQRADPTTSAPLAAAPWSDPGTRGAIVWLTGLSGAGKSTIGGALLADQRARGRLACLLDGDELRAGLCGDLGYSEGARLENVRRVAHVARLVADLGAVVIVALISPARAARAEARRIAGPTPFLEVFVDAPLSVCERRDVKGLYRRARSGELAGLTGISAPYEAPLAPELTLASAVMSVDECVRRIVAALRPG